MNAIISQEDRDYIIARYREAKNKKSQLEILRDQFPGLSKADICEICGIDAKEMEKKKTNRGQNMKSKHDEALQKAVELWNAGYTIDAICMKMNRATSGVRNLLTEAGIFKKYQQVTQETCKAIPEAVPQIVSHEDPAPAATENEHLSIKKVGDATVVTLSPNGIMTAITAVKGQLSTCLDNVEKGLNLFSDASYEELHDVAFPLELDAAAENLKLAQDTLTAMRELYEQLGIVEGWT